LKRMHPYYPPTLSLPHYIENTYATTYLLSSVFIYFLMVFIPIQILSSTNRSLTFLGKLSLFWYVLNFLLHLIFEGYYIFNYGKIHENNGFMAQLWKEYSLADSRYLIKDGMTFSLELITVIIIAPLCFINSMFIYCNSIKQYPLTIIIESFHLFSVSVYFISAYLENMIYTRPETLYYYVYFWLMNAPWIMIPFLRCCYAWKFICENLLELKFIREDIEIQEMNLMENQNIMDVNEE
ncbi:hypothetical protein K502DRAFT_293501, partial [Neoconidiobolus thromboides FSU 785]